jgi:hypothetical protein
MRVVLWAHPEEQRHGRRAQPWFDEFEDKRKDEDAQLTRFDPASYPSSF